MNEDSHYIKDEHPDWIIEQADGSIKLKREALKSNNENTNVEANQVVFNSPDLFEPEPITE